MKMQYEIGVLSLDYLEAKDLSNRIDDYVKYLKELYFKIPKDDTKARNECEAKIEFLPKIASALKDLGLSIKFTRKVEDANNTIYEGFVTVAIYALWENKSYICEAIDYSLKNEYNQFFINNFDIDNVNQKIIKEVYNRINRIKKLREINHIIPKSLEIKMTGEGYYEI